VNARVKFLLIGLAVLGLAYPGVAWLIGLRAEALMQRREQQALDLFPGNVTLISRQYHRGVFSSTEDLTFGLGPTVLRALGPLTTTSDLAALHVTVHNSIYHGPLPQLRSFGLATVSTQVQLPPEVSVKLRELSAAYRLSESKADSAGRAVQRGRSSVRIIKGAWLMAPKSAGAASKPLRARM